ncbi:Actin cytoskeleton-regulatory complex protein sla1 [Frankliniella fusca]|uniref:Actin cytoskeleton-regulatory complex protein sla1 n=1 Tax=Frankliniella fusca TaxID=407009 RepID=A0AAE1L863_9NEOP|nr:Actin cytoskeleton-regulatory complex protein sla1 [Frankliniella fusca]
MSNFHGRFVNVEFLAEDGNIAAVPLLWVRNKRIGQVDGQKAVLGKCYWPPNSLKRKVTRLAAKQQAPDTKTWSLWDVELLQYNSTLEESRKNLGKQSSKEEEPDRKDSSEDETTQEKRETRNKSRTRRGVRRDSGSGSSEEEEYAVNVDALKKLHCNTEPLAKSGDEGYLSQSVRAQDDSLSLAADWESDAAGTQDIFADIDSTTVGDNQEVAEAVQKSPMRSFGLHELRRKTPQKESGSKSPGQTRHKQKTTPAKRDSGKASPKPSTPKDRGAPNQNRASTPRKVSPQKRQVSPQKRQVSPQKRQVSPFKRQESTQKDGGCLDSPEKSLNATAQDKRVSPVVTGSISSPTGGSPGKRSGLHIFESPMPDRQKRRKDSDLTYTAPELEGINNELEMLNVDFSPLDSMRSASPALSCQSDDSTFKTPREKGAYRALNFGTCSPSVASGIRHLQVMLDENVQRLRAMDRSQQALLTLAKESFQKILSCVLPPLESNIAEDIPRLPLTDKDGEKALNNLISDKIEFNKVVTFLYGLGGTSPKDALYSAMKTLFADDFACTKSMKGIRRAGKPPKDAFVGTNLFKAVMCAIRRRYKDTTVSEVMEMTGNWLKDAPSREKKRLRRKESRERIQRAYDEDSGDDESA